MMRSRRWLGALLLSLLTCMPGSGWTLDAGLLLERRELDPKRATAATAPWRLLLPITAQAQLQAHRQRRVLDPLAWGGLDAWEPLRLANLAISQGPAPSDTDSERADRMLAAMALTRDVEVQAIMGLADREYAAVRPLVLHSRLHPRLGGRLAGDQQANGWLVIRQRIDGIGAPDWAPEGLEILGHPVQTTPAQRAYLAACTGYREAIRARPQREIELATWRQRYTQTLLAVEQEARALRAAIRDLSTPQQETLLLLAGVID